MINVTKHDMVYDVAARLASPCILSNIDTLNTGKELYKQGNYV